MDQVESALLITAALIALLVVVELLALIVRAVALRRAHARVAAGTLSRNAALLRVRRFGRRTLSFVLLAACVSPILVLGIPWASGSSIVDPHVWIGIFGVVYTSTLLVYSVLGPITIEARVRRSLRGLTPPASPIFLIALKTGLITYLPIALVCVGLAAASSNQWALGIWLFCLVAVAWKTFTHLFSGHLTRFVYPTRPADGVAAPGLSDRVALWAARCGAAMPDVRIWQTASYGFAAIDQVGVLDRTLLVSDNTLTSMDWRQQDAFIVYAIQARRSIGNYATLSICAEVVVYGLIGYAFTGSTLGPATASLSAILLLSVAPALSRQFRSQGLAYPRHPDLLAAEVTGDPLALMVGMNTLATLNDASDGFSNASVPVARLEDRMRALDAWMQTPGPRAPWAYQPVPSRWPVTANSYLLTAPLDSAPPPAPVPTSPYPALAPSPVR